MILLQSDETAAYATAEAAFTKAASVSFYTNKAMAVSVFSLPRNLARTRAEPISAGWATLPAPSIASLASTSGPAAKCTRLDAASLAMQPSRRCRQGEQ